MPVKYKQYFRNAIKKNKDLFDSFDDIYEKYDGNPKKWENDFKKLGGEVLIELKKTEDKLCQQSEKSSYAKFSQQLADKFWEEVRKHYPKIDEVGSESISERANPAAEVINDLF